MTQGTLRWLAALGLVAGVMSGCGQEPETTPPSISNVTINCGMAPTDSFVDVPVIREISASVEDPDRDLIRVEGSVDGILIEAFTDDDADRTYNWTPPTSLDPMRCDGQVTVRLKAIDQAGNVTDEVAKLTPMSSM